MTPFEECAARLAKDVDFLLLDRKGQEDDAAAMLEIWDQDHDALSVAALLDAIPGAAKPQGKAPKAFDPFADDLPAAQPEEAPAASDSWLQRFKDATVWLNNDLGEVLGVKGVTVQAYTAGRIRENFDRKQKDALRQLCATVRDQLAELSEQL